MPTFEKLPQAKLRAFVGKQITIEKVISGTSSFGPYVLLVTKTESIISSHKVVMATVEKPEFRANLPRTVTVTETEGKNGYSYLNLE